MVNIVLCGTPGTGKSTIIEMVKDKLDDINSKVNFINISQFAKDNDCIEEYDADLDTHVIDEDKLEEKLRPIAENPGKINLFESIHADIIPEHLVNHVFVVIMENHTHLYDRLVARNYNQAKLTNNIECEIFQEIKDNSLEVFGRERVTILYNDTMGYLVTNAQQICDKILQFISAS